MRFVYLSIWARSEGASLIDEISMSFASWPDRNLKGRFICLKNRDLGNIDRFILH